MSSCNEVGCWVAVAILIVEVVILVPLLIYCYVEFYKRRPSCQCIATDDNGKPFCRYLFDEKNKKEECCCITQDESKEVFCCCSKKDPKETNSECPHVKERSPRTRQRSRP